MEYGYKNEKPFDTAVRLITEFCDSEYGDDEQDCDTAPDLTDLSNIPLAHTETEQPINGKYLGIQVTADLEKYRIFKEVGGIEVSSEKYSSIEKMIPALANLEFDELVALSDEEIKNYKKADKDVKTRIVETMYIEPLSTREMLKNEYNKLSKDEIYTLLDTVLETVENTQNIKQQKEFIRYTAGGLEIDNGWADRELFNSEYTVPEGTTVLEKGYFNSCSFLKTVTIPDSVQFINNNAFSGFDDDIIIKCNYNSEAADFAREHGIYREYIDKNYSSNAVADYVNFTYDYTSSDFQSGEVGNGFPIMICVNTAERYAFCMPTDFYDKEFQSAYNNAYEDCVMFGKRTCNDYEDFNRLARQLASKIDYRENLEQGEGDALDVCFSYNNGYEDDYEDEVSRGR